MPRLERAIRDRRARYATATGLVLLALLLRLLLLPIEAGVPFLTFYPAVVLVALLCGAAPGILATALSAILVDYVFFPPHGSLSILDVKALLQLGVFIGSGLLICLIAWQKQLHVDALEAANRAQEATLATLASRTEELETFTYAASHDMKAPLGRISAYSGLLNQRYRDRLDPEGRQFLHFVQENATRLNALVADLLTHTEIGQAPHNRQPVDIANLVRAILDERTDSIARAGADIRLDLSAETILECNRPALMHALRHLVDNAIKYSAQAHPPVIEIGSRKGRGQVRIWVRDNGIGIDPAYQQSIFRAFQRLHNQQEFAGTGIGLALVAKAMKHMGGTVRVESTPGQGATFFLELPA